MDIEGISPHVINQNSVVLTDVCLLGCGDEISERRRGAW